MIWVFILSLAGLLVYEIWAIRRPAPGDTISELFWRAARRPLLPFLIGVLAGHLVWQSAGSCL